MLLSARLRLIAPVTISMEVKTPEDYAGLSQEHFVMAMSREHLPRKDVPASHVTSLRLWKLKKASKILWS